MIMGALSSQGNISLEARNLGALNCSKKSRWDTERPKHPFFYQWKNRQPAVFFLGVYSYHISKSQKPRHKKISLDNATACKSHNHHLLVALRIIYFCIFTSWLFLLDYYKWFLGCLHIWCFERCGVGDKGVRTVTVRLRGD